MFLDLSEQALEMIYCFTFENTMALAKIIQVIGHYSNRISAVPQYVECVLKPDTPIFAIHSQSFCHSELQVPQTA